MSKLNIVRRCHNCGVILQGENPQAPGYIDPAILENTSARVLFCNKCFDESRYNFVPRAPKVSEEFLSMLEDAEASDSLIVYIVDLFSFENSFVPEVTHIIEGLNILIVANKRDLLPANYDDDLLREYVAHRFRNARLRVTRDDVMLASMTSMADSSAILEEIEKRRMRHDVYVIGAIGAGKTQFISSFLHSYSNESHRVITSANYPGTSLRIMQIPLDTSTFIYETPGISLDNTIQSKLDLANIQAVTPSGPVKARSLTVEAGDSILIGGVVRLDLLRGEKQEIKAYFAKEVTISKVRTSKADDAFLHRRGAIVPVSSALTSLTDFDAFDLDVEEEGDRDIGVAGLGWIHFIGQGQRWRIFTPKNVAIYHSRSKIK